MVSHISSASFTAISVAAAGMCMCSISGAPPLETDGGFARFGT